MGNPRDYAAPGNQDPATPWPDSLVLASAIAASTSRLRIALAAVIAPLRHPLLLAKQLATLDLLSEGRLVVQPTVSWHEQEYDALGVPFHQRGAILDEQLEAMAAAWRDTPAAYEGRHFRFADVYLEPKPFRPEGPRMWFGGQSLHPPLLRRLVRYGHGFHPFGSPTPAELEQLRDAMAAAGRDCRRAGDGRRHPRDVRRRDERRRPGAGGRGHPGPARPGLHARSASSRRCSRTTSSRSARSAASSWPASPRSDSATVQSDLAVRAGPRSCTWSLEQEPHRDRVPELSVRAPVLLRPEPFLDEAALAVEGDRRRRSSGRPRGRACAAPGRGPSRSPRPRAPSRRRGRARPHPRTSRGRPPRSARPRR